MKKIKYRPIKDYAMIGNCRTTALVHKEGSIDFYCYPRFDSPSIFARLLDSEKGGFFNTPPIDAIINSSQKYLLGTNVLMTRLHTEPATIDCFDFMPKHNSGEANQIMRIIKVVRGKSEFRLKIHPKPNYGDSNIKILKQDKFSIRFQHSSLKNHQFSITSNISIFTENETFIKTFVLKQGEIGIFTLGEPFMPQLKNMDLGAYVEKQMDLTVSYWKNWSSQCTYNGDYQHFVNRSALTLKLLTSEEYGSTVAAATFSLPEKIGGSRNYDYRFTWIRDAAFTMYAFMSLGFFKESQAFMSWIQQRIETDLDNDVNLQIMYKVDGSKDLKEQTVELEGYRSSSPVRIGNAATDQIQMDIFGELMDTIYLFDKYGEPISFTFWKKLEVLLDFVCENWNREDHGIWEVREEKRHYLYTRTMCWVALDRAEKMVRKRSFPTNLERWIKTKNDIYMDIQENFWNKELNSFVHFIGAKTVDCSMLIMPLVHAISPYDKKWIATMEVIEEQLVSDVLVYRNMKDSSPKNNNEEGTFLIGAFWYVEALARGGRLNKASFHLEKLLDYGNHVNLFAEELEETGEHLGNFPQAFTHLGLISAVLNLDKYKNSKSNYGTTSYELI